MSLTACTDVSPATWIASSGTHWQRLVAFGPPGFEAYARLRFLADPSYVGQTEADVDDDAVPGEHDVLRGALDVLSQHTRTPDDCYYCLWDGWDTDIDGVSHQGTTSAFDRSILSGPKVVIPNRSYYLFRGPLAQFGIWPTVDRARCDDMPDPAFIWPSDHSWCIANDVDPHYAGVGASSAAIHRLLSHPNLDVAVADPRAEQPTYD